MIRVLEDRVVNKIAAGEVVERPASVVKELLENALDAGANVVRVELKGGGRELVRVSDDGEGMHRQDAMLCLERHATSKIRTDEDLFRVATLGFRGEAIPSIAAVSRFEIVTRRPADEVGTRVVVEGGRLAGIEDAGCPVGTRVSARTLFFNVPARRKFLRTVPTELAHCLEAVTREALIRPDLDVEVLQDGSSTVRAPKVADRAARAADLLGPHGRSLVPVSFRSGALEVVGLVSPVGVHRGSATGSSYLYVNGRFVRDPLLRRAINEAFRGIVPKGRFPVVVLEVRVPPEDVDVNVHPAKTEVRFQHALSLQRALADGVRAALQGHGIKQPVADEPRYRPRDAPPVEDHQQALPVRPMPGPLYALPDWPVPLVRDGATQDGGSPADRWTSPPHDAVPPEPAPPGDLLPVPRFSDLRVLGQLARTYVLCEGRGELVIVDQHAAHERITLYRLLLAEQAKAPSGQRLLAPAMVELSPARARALAANTEVLSRFGLEVEPFGGNTFAVKQVPASLASADPQRLIDDVADDLAVGGAGEPARDHLEHVLATMACHTSVRAGQVLSAYEMRALLAELDKVDFSVCAHGRPVVIRISGAELEARFHRS